MSDEEQEHFLVFVQPEEKGVELRDWGHPYGLALILINYHIPCTGH